MTAATAENQNLAKLLIAAGYQPRVARALAWLVRHEAGTITSREMEIGANLRQPEAHYAINILTDRGTDKSVDKSWIKVVPVATEIKPRGRPEYRYEYALTKEQAFRKIQAKAGERIAGINGNLEEIKAAIMEAPVA